MQTLWLLGGLGLGAGLMYLMDSAKGAGRRERIRGYVGDFGRQTSALVDDTRRTLGRQAQAVLAPPRRPFRRQPGLGERLHTQATPRGMPTGVALVGGVGLGAASSLCSNPRGAPSGGPGCASKRVPTGAPRTPVTRPSKSCAGHGASIKVETRSA